MHLNYFLICETSIHITYYFEIGNLYSVGYVNKIKISYISTCKNKAKMSNFGFFDDELQKVSSNKSTPAIGNYYLTLINLCLLSVWSLCQNVIARI